MKTRFMIVCLLMVLCLLLGCQPTPDKSVVVNKADGKLKEKIQATPAPTLAYEAPAHWSETVEGDKLNIVIDADIKLPDVSAYPVVKLEPVPYTQEQIDAMVHYFAGDAEFYLPPVKTKTDYDEEIIEAKRPLIFEGEKIEWNSNDYVKQLEEMRAAAPDDSPVIYTDTTLTYKKDSVTGEDITKYGKNYLAICFKNADGGEGTIMATNDAQYLSFSYRGSDAKFISESNYRDTIDGGESEEESGWVGAGALFDKVTVDEEDAKLKAQQVISDLNIKDLMFVSCEKSVSPNAPEKCGYEVTYARQCGDIAVYLVGGGRYSEGEAAPAYSPPFGEEIVRIDISQFGVESFWWSGYAHEVEKVSDNVVLLPFEEVKQKLKRQIFYKKSFNASQNMTDNDTVNVISAELRLGYIGVKDRADQALLVPVWVFETTYRDKVNGIHEDYPDETYVLNAIDGGVIEMKRIEFKDIPAG